MKKDIDERIVCAGFGGQGIMLMGKLIALVGMEEGYHVTWLPSYGAEVRGGTAHSMIHISQEEISSPAVFRPSTCVVMNKPSLLKFMNRMRKDGLLIINSSMVDRIVEKKAIRIAALPFSQLASDLGNIKVANMIAVGVLVRLKKLFSLKSVLDSLEKALPGKKDALSLNKEAINLGFKLAREV